MKELFEVSTIIKSMRVVARCYDTRSIKKRSSYNFISIIIYLIDTTITKIHPNFRAPRIWSKNARSSESKEIDHFHPILEMKELRNKKVMLLAQGFMALRHNLIITIHSKKKDQHNDVYDALQRAHAQ